MGSLETALENFRTGDQFPASMNSLLQKHLKPSTKAKECNRFTLGSRIGQGGIYHHSLYADLYADGEYSILLYYKKPFSHKKPVAISSIDPIYNAAFIKQIQGVRGKREELSKIKWTFALVDAWCQWAALNSVPEVWILPSAQSVWSAVRDSNAGYLYYDKTAQRMGFNYDDNLKMYKKQMSIENFQNP